MTCVTVSHFSAVTSPCVTPSPSSPFMATTVDAGASGMGEDASEELSHVKLMPKSPAGVSGYGGHWAGTDLDGHVEGDETVASSKVAVHHACRKQEH